MNYTKNHHLPQWVTSDRVKMDDFNAAMASIENGLDAAQTAASSAQTAAATAQTTANTAKTNAASALTKANAAYAPGNKPYAVGSYTGNGLTGQLISVGFQPSLVIISGMTETSSTSDYSTIVPYFAITADNTNVRRRVQINSDGFAVYYAGNYDLQLPNLNKKGHPYDYIAFR